MKIPPPGTPGPSNAATMAQSPSPSSTTTNSLTLPNALLSALRAGQILNAQVVAQSPTNGETTLRIQNATVQLHSTAQLREGQRLTLQITDPTQGIQARVLTNATNNVAQLAARQSLPLQMALAPLLNNLLQISQLAAAQTTQIPEALRQLAQELLRQVPRWQTTRDAATLRSAIAQSGLFFEAMLGQGEVPDADLKANLLRILTTLQGHAGNRSAQLSNSLQVPPPLRYGPMHAPEPGASTAQTVPLQLGNIHRQLIGALARIELTQLASIATDSDQARVILTEIPLRNDAAIDVLQLRIEQEEKAPSQDQDRDEKPNWSVQLAFELSGLGPLYIRLGLRGKSISSTFWAERTQTKQLIDKHLELYRENLRRTGIPSGPITAHVGRPPDSHKRPITPQLNVDVKV